MRSAGAARFLTGRDRSPTEATVLRAGPLTVLLDGADLRLVRLGPVELIQRVYVAVRDAPWNTIPAIFSGWQVHADDDHFRVAFHARHRYESIDFEWDGLILGGTNGVIQYTMDGRCQGVFEYSKIGFNVHHALAGSVGRGYRARTPDGELRGILPNAIAPQRIVDGTLSGMFDPYDELAIEVVDGVESVIGLEGDLLELQDHRNWTDGNFKSYATPLALGFPFESTDGQTIRQVLSIGYRGSRPEETPEAASTIQIDIPAERRLPALGFGRSSGGAPLSEREITLLRAARPDHLRVDLVLTDPTDPAALERAAIDARAVGATLELAISANEGSGPAAAALADRLRALEVQVARVLVYLAADGFSALSSLTPAAVVRLVRDALEPVTGPVVFAGGTNQNFSDVNRDRPSDAVMTGVCFSVSPTVHAADDRSIVENLVGQFEVVRMARSFSGDRAICVSPVTLATRFGPYPAGPSAPGDLPAAVDVRQASLLGAAWTVGSIAQFAASGADSVTYFETTGRRGIMASDRGSPDPRFPSDPGDVFPMYHVFADLAEWRAGLLTPTTRSDSGGVAAIFLATPDRQRHGLVACLAPDPLAVVVDGLPDGPARVRSLDADSAAQAMGDPQAFRASGQEVRVIDGRLRLELGAYGIVRIDTSAAPS